MMHQKHFYRRDQPAAAATGKYQKHKIRRQIKQKKEKRSQKSDVEIQIIFFSECTHNCPGWKQLKLQSEKEEKKQTVTSEKLQPSNVLSLKISLVLKKRWKQFNKHLRFQRKVASRQFSDHTEIPARVQRCMSSDCSPNLSSSAVFSQHKLK